MNHCSVAVGCPAARPGPAPQRRSPDERQDNYSISLGSCGRLRVVRALTWPNGHGVASPWLAAFTVIPRSIWCAFGAVAVLCQEADAQRAVSASGLPTSATCP